MSLYQGVIHMTMVVYSIMGGVLSLVSLAIYFSDYANDDNRLILLMYPIFIGLFVCAYVHRNHKDQWWIS